MTLQRVLVFNWLRREFAPYRLLTCASTPLGQGSQTHPRATSDRPPNLHILKQNRFTSPSSSTAPPSPARHAPRNISAPAGPCTAAPPSPRSCPRKGGGGGEHHTISTPSHTHTPFQPHHTHFHKHRVPHRQVPVPRARQRNRRHLLKHLRLALVIARFVHPILQA